ncbi:MAG: oligosaccharide flippase family protein [Gammaproteobacteria bacterium]|nr:oligosaccharide flippase family protein [Gammaproteobacteria bacterium]
MIKLLLSYLTGALLAGLVGILSTFLLTRMLSPAAYGEGMLFVSTLECLFFLCNVGMDQVFVRHFYEPMYRHKLSLLLYRCIALVLFNTIFIFLILALTGVAKPIFTAFHIPYSSSWLYCLLIGTVLFVFLRFSQLIPRLLENPKIYSAANFIRGIFFLGSALLFIYSGHKNANTIIYAELLAMTFTVSSLIIIYRRQWSPLSVSYHELFERTEIKSFLYYGVPFVFSLSLTWVFNNIDKFMLLKWSNLHELGIYTAAFALASPLVMLQSVFTTAWAPKMNQLMISDGEQAKSTLRKTFRNTAWILTLSALVLIILKKIIVLFLGPQFRSASDVFPWLLFMPYFYALSEITAAGIVKFKKSIWNIPISLTCLAANLIGCYFLIPRFGAEGAAIAVAMSFALFFILRTSIAFKYYQFKISYLELIFLVCMLFFIVVRYS